MKLNLKENRPVACGVLAVIVALSLFVGGGSALKARGRAVDGVFSAASESRLAAEYFSVPAWRSSCISSKMTVLKPSRGSASFQPRSRR